MMSNIHSSCNKTGRTRCLGFTQYFLLLVCSTLCNLALRKIVLLGELQISQELGVTSLQGHMSHLLRLLDSIPMSLSALVVIGMILTLRHFIFSCRSESSNIS